MNGNQETISILKFDDPRWETLSAPKRDALITELTVRQVEFARQEVPFYASLYKDLKLGDLNDLHDCAARIPAITKDHIRSLPTPFELIPRSVRANPGKLWLHRGTGGTTGLPTSVFFTQGDFKAIMDGNNRITRLARNAAPQFITFNGYNQGHISGPYFDEVVRRLGAVPISRNFGSTDEQAVVQMRFHQCNSIIAPPVSTHKGGSVQNLLDADIKTGTNYINGDNIRLLVISSTGITRELYEELTLSGIRHIVNMYGSTDVGAIANSPPWNPFELIVNFGHSSSFVLGKNQEPVRNGERGLLVSSRIGSYDDQGSVIPNQGTQLINFHLGDEVTYHDRCSVDGWTLPSISQVVRVMNVQEKIEGGCERW